MFPKCADGGALEEGVPAILPTCDSRCLVTWPLGRTSRVLSVHNIAQERLTQVKRKAPALQKRKAQLSGRRRREGILHRRCMRRRAEMPPTRLPARITSNQVAGARKGVWLPSTIDPGSLPLRIRECNL